MGGQPRKRHENQTKTAFDVKVAAHFIVKPLAGRRPHLQRRASLTPANQSLREELLLRTGGIAATAIPANTARIDAGQTVRAGAGQACHEAASGPNHSPSVSASVSVGGSLISVVMKLIEKKYNHPLFDRDLPPVATVQPGAELVFETLDACCGEVRSVEQLIEFRKKPPRAGDPLTGPVYIQGAKPGHTLTVDILRIELDADGFQLIGPNRAIIRDEVPDWTCYAFRAENGRLIFPNGINVPASPLIGTFGNAPAGKPTSCPNPLGGDIDCPYVRVGARLYIPVEVEGALFSLGDIHACQGDGEIVGAPEIGGRVAVRLGLLPHRQAEGFMIEDAEDWHSCGTADNEGEAAKLAVFQNARFLCKKYAVELKDALILLTLIGRLTISRTAKWGSHNEVVCSSFSKNGVENALRAYRTAQVG
jgi:amidase